MGGSRVTGGDDLDRTEGQNGGTLDDDRCYFSYVNLFNVLIGRRLDNLGRLDIC